MLPPVRIQGYKSSYGTFVQLQCIRMSVYIQCHAHISILIDMVAFVYGYVHGGMYFTAIIAVFITN